jgi:hypothetical protein
MVYRTSWILVCLLIVHGCSAQAPSVDDTPFRAAIGEYLKANNMAMKIKEIKKPPVITGDAAQLQASLTHEQLGGPAVTWDFEFAKQADGTWKAIKHQD